MIKSHLNSLIGQGIYRGFMNLQRRFIKATKKKVNGLHGIYYYEIGNPKKETIVLVHGFGDNKDNYLQTAAKLYKDYHILIPDLPGFGDNPLREEQTYNLKYMAQSIESLLNEKDIKSCHLLGNSLGGATSMQVTLQNPDIIKSLTLVDTAGFFKEGVRSVFHDFFEGNNIFQVSTEKEYEGLLKRVFVTPPYIPSPVMSFFAKHCREHHNWYGKMFKDLAEGISSEKEIDKIQELSFNTRASKIEIPTLLIWGDKDSLFPLELGELAHQSFPNSTLKVLKNVGHAPQYEDFKGYMKAFEEFLKNN